MEIHNQRGIPPTAYNAHWYLREGDFLPEPASSLFGGKGISCQAHLDILVEAGNLFQSKEEALQASRAVRELLAQRALSAKDGSRSKDSQNPLSLALSACRTIQKHYEEIAGLLQQLQEQTQESACGHSHSGSPANGQGKHQV